jgi:creatinine amidohydrolase
MRPDSVRVDQISVPGSKPVDWNKPELDFSLYSTTGVIGDPTHASAELGAKLWRQAVHAMAAVINDTAEAL